VKKGVVKNDGYTWKRNQYGFFTRAEKIVIVAQPKNDSLMGKVSTLMKSGDTAVPSLYEKKVQPHSSIHQKTETAENTKTKEVARHSQVETPTIHSQTKENSPTSWNNMFISEVNKGIEGLEAQSIAMKIFVFCALAVPLLFIGYLLGKGRGEDTQNELDEENAALKEESRRNRNLKEKNAKLKEKKLRLETELQELHNALEGVVVWHKLSDNLAQLDSRSGVYLQVVDVNDYGEYYVKLAGAPRILVSNVNEHLSQEGKMHRKSREDLRVARF
jgi:hypothetical protein